MNSDERDYAEEAANRTILETGDGETLEQAMSNERIYSELRTYSGAGMIDYVLPTEPLGEQWIIGWRGQILKFLTAEGIVGFLAGIQTATVFIAEKQDIDISAFAIARQE
jgi:hypothetical protein